VNSNIQNLNSNIQDLNSNIQNLNSNIQNLNSNIQNVSKMIKDIVTYSNIFNIRISISSIQNILCFGVTWHLTDIKLKCFFCLKNYKLKLWVRTIKLFTAVTYAFGLLIGNCDICAERKILFMNETKWNEIWSWKNFLNVYKI